MFICECGRSFSRQAGLSRHKNHCGDIFYDRGYKCKIGLDGKTVYIHKEVMEQKLGRKLTKGEIVHHIDENKVNNNPDNLELTNRSKHAIHHYDPNIQGKNIQYKKDRVGEKLSHSKLKNFQVIIIKHMIKNKKSINLIGAIFKVHPVTISNIKTERYWKHIQI